MCSSDLQVREAIPNVSILGMGGVASGKDAFEMILAGASGVSIGTANFSDPSAPHRIQNELKEILLTKGFNSMKEAVGYAHRPEA